MGTIHREPLSVRCAAYLMSRELRRMLPVPLPALSPQAAHTHGGRREPIAPRVYLLLHELVVVALALPNVMHGITD